MTISEIINKYNALNKDTDKEALIQRNYIKPYVPIIHKKEICEKIIQHSFVDGQIDLIAKYVMYILALVDSHMSIDIDYTGNDIYLVYDKLRECGILQYILGQLSEDEVSEFNIVMDSVCDVI